MRQQEPQRAVSPPSTKRLPGRSFEDPSKPLGEELLDRSAQSVESPEGGVYGREDVGAEHQGSVVSGIAERAKAISVLRKAEELMAAENPPPENIRRALQLAAGRVGLKIEEYETLIRNDPELQKLERQVVDAAEQVVAGGPGYGARYPARH